MNGIFARVRLHSFPYYVRYLCSINVQQKKNKRCFANPYSLKERIFVRVLFRNKPHVFSVQGMKEAIRFFSVEAFCLASIGFSFKNQMFKGMVAHDFPPPAFRNFITFF